jgi:diguanylate cyclase (GGDEF)-like protein/PAS domain S-box-containing protein
LPRQPSGHRGDTEGLWEWNLASDRIHFSPRWISLVGCEEHEVGNTPEEWLQRLHPEDRDTVLREIETARKDGAKFDFPHRLRHKDGSYRWMSCRGVGVRNKRDAIVRLMGSHADITADTVTDRLTGLPNRLLLVDRLSQSVERATRYKGFHFALLLVDLGRTPRHADSSLPVGGDPLLTAAARRLETSLRIGRTTPTLRHNDLVARLEGDQFAVLLDGLKDIGHAKLVADRILGEILKPFTVGGREIFLPANIGIAVSATGYTHADDVLRDSEAALHRGRVLGGSCCEIFDTAILKSEQVELQLEGEFTQALERREFRLVYQPIVSLESNQIVGFEALLRWDHPVLGTIPPADFICLAERTGFIVPLGDWVLREGCRQTKEWQDSLPLAADLWISINLSGVQLKDAALVERVAETLRHSGLPARSLVLELTEGVAMENPAAVKSLLMQLRSMGIRISVDDFGTGYSSLAYLRQFPVDTLKVDRSFVRGMETHKDTAEIVGSLTALAQQLGLHVVAEGVENEEQLSLLRALQCDSAQGYLLAKPLDVNGATEVLRNGLRPDSGADNAPATGPATRRVGITEKRAWLSPRGRSLALATAAALVLTTGAVIAWFTDGLRSDDQSSSALTRQNGEQPLPATTTTASASLQPATPVTPAPTVATSIQTSTTTAFTPTVPVAASQTPSSATATARTKPPALTMPSKPSLQAKAAIREPIAVTANAPAIPIIERPTASIPAAPRSAAQAVTTVSVMHLHRVGSCEGNLVVSRDAIAFVPDDKANKDAFVFKFGEFLHTLSDGRLTIRSAARTYRFRVAAADGNDDGESQLRRLVENFPRNSHAF